MTRRNTIPQPFIIGEEEQLVFENGAANGPAKLVLGKSPFCDPAEVVAPTVGSKALIFEIFEDVAMEAAGSLAMPMLSMET